MSANTPALAGGSPAPRRGGRRLVRGLAILVGVVVVAVAAVYATAWLTLDRWAVSRALIWRDSDIDDYRRFESRPIPAGDAPFRYAHGPGYPDGLPAALLPGEPDFAAFLARSDTTAFIVIRNDEIIYERYFNGHDAASTETSFSVAKSFNSAMVGAAIAAGRIAGVDDPVTKYLPELLERDRRFGDITLRHLLGMTSGLRYEETGTPWGDDSRTYYSPDLRALGLAGTEIAEPPGRRFHYNNYNPMLIGMVIERATGMPVADWLARSIWQPMGAEADASWSLDSARSGFEKMESGINGRALDFAKLGSLYLHRGAWNGSQILPAEWIDETTKVAADPTEDYQLGWWTYRDPRVGDAYAARGNHGQAIFVSPRDNLVIVRHGSSFGGVEWGDVAAAIAVALRAPGA